MTVELGFLMRLKRLENSQQWFLSVLLLTLVLILVYSVGYDGYRENGISVYDAHPPRILPNPPKRRATVTFWGRNGNHMFEYGTLIGACKRNNMTPILIESTTLWNMFKLPIPKRTINSLGMYLTYSDILPAVHSNVTEVLSPYHDAYLMGYFQSWRYFENVKEELVRDHFVFHDHLKKQADDYIANARREHKKEKAVLVAVHVRRGDFVRQKRKGYTVAPIPYFYRAMNYFRKKYKDVLFILCSNDVIWSHDNLDDAEDVHFSHNTDGYLDFAIMSSCNHMIMSAGSYSWWAGYMCGGEVIYYKGYPEPNTVIGNKTKKADYYPPTWIPM